MRYVSRKTLQINFTCAFVQYDIKLGFYSRDKVAGKPKDPRATHFVPRCCQVTRI